MNNNPSLIHILSSNRWGGIERYAFDISCHFLNEGWDVKVLTRDAKAVDDLFSKASIPLIHAPLQGLTDFNSIKLLSQKIKETENPVIIHVHGFRMAFTALMARRHSKRNDVRIIMTRHKVRKAVDSWILRWLYRNIDALIFVSRAARDRFLATWNNSDLPFQATKLHVIHNSLNLSLNSDNLSDNSSRPLTAMFHGPLKPGKGLETLIDALALLKGKRIRLRIVGSGNPDYVDKIRRRAIAKGVMDMIDWHKHTDNPLPLIHDCDFGVLPSTLEEAFGLSNIEYMYAGRPQICSSNGAQPEYLTDGWEGFLIPPGNSVFLAETIEKLALNPQLRQKMGERALETFTKRLSWPNFISRLIPVYLNQS